MNAHERNIAGQPADIALIHGGGGECAVVEPGRYVSCAVSGVRIPLEALRYWSPELQEAYAGPGEALARWKALNP